MTFGQVGGHRCNMHTIMLIDNVVPVHHNQGMGANDKVQRDPARVRPKFLPITPHYPQGCPGCRGVWPGEHAEEECRHESYCAKHQAEAKDRALDFAERVLRRRNHR